MSIPLVSVIVPAYNCERTLEETVRSVINQTCGDWELIVVDDASSDGTRPLIECLSKIERRIQAIFCEQNGGVALARNRGIDAARGTYLAFLDGDDTWEPDKLERQLEVLARSGCDLCYTSYDFMALDGQPLGTAYMIPTSTSYKRMLRENVVGCSTVLLKREALGDFFFDESFCHEDYVLWLKLLRDGASFQGISDVLVHYRLGGRSSGKWKAARNRWEVYRRGERLSIGTSIWYFIGYALRGLLKYIRE